MTRRFRVIQCPRCQEYAYFPDNGKRQKCPRCNASVELMSLQGIDARSATEAQRAVEARQYAMHNMQPPTASTNASSPSSEVIRLLRRQHAVSPQWMPLVDVVRHCVKMGLSSQQVQGAIAALVDQGFLELREGSIRVISIT